MNNILSVLKAMLFPERCPYCNCVIEAGKPACNVCIKLMPQTFLENHAIGGYPCYSPFFYNSIFATAVKRFKFSNYPQSAKKLAIPLAQSVLTLSDVKFDYVTCVPMHPKRERARGYNQSELLATEASKLMGVPYSDLLKKIKNNDEQHKCKTSAQRRDNVKGVYKAINNEKIKGKRILIIDDIFTTGYTLGECCRVLERGGSGAVRCATVCAKNNV